MKNESWNQIYGCPDGGGYGRPKRFTTLDRKTKPADPKVVINYLKNMSDEEWNKYVILCAPETVYDHIKTFLDPGAVYEIQQHRGRKENGLCPHGNDASECNPCFVASDTAFDAARKDRFR